MVINKKESNIFEIIFADEINKIIIETIKVKLR